MVKLDYSNGETESFPRAASYIVIGSSSYASGMTVDLYKADGTRFATRTGVRHATVLDVLDEVKAKVETRGDS